MQGLVLVVSSFPRSGTHFLLDLLRLNFRELAWNAPIWASAEDLYYNLDRSVLNGPAWSEKCLTRENFIVKTHRIPFEPPLRQKLDDIADGRRIAFVTPVRALSSQLASYQRFASKQQPADSFLSGADPFYGSGMSVKDAVMQFYNHALANSHLVNVEKGRNMPDELIDHLGQQLGLERSSQTAVLPKKRRSHGLVGELAARLSGRPSSEVIVPVPSADGKSSPFLIDDEELVALDQQLQKRANF